MKPVNSSSTFLWGYFCLWRSLGSSRPKSFKRRRCYWRHWSRVVWCEKKMITCFQTVSLVRIPPWYQRTRKELCRVKWKTMGPISFAFKTLGGRTFAAVKCCLKKVNRRIRGRRPSCGILAASPKLYKLLVSCDQGLLFFYMMYKDTR